MATRPWILLLVFAAISMLAGCGGGSTANVQNPPPPPVQTVSIAFQSVPTGSLQPSQPTNLTAVVNNDASNAGVDWTVACQVAGNCGSLSSLHTSSGQAITYTPPSTLSGNTLTVNIVAFATADHTQNVDAAITITAFGNNLTGTYVLQVQGVDASLGRYQFAGAIVLDGNGQITSGKQTVNFLDLAVGSLLSKSVPIAGGSYFLGAHGRGTITVNTNDPEIGLNGTETFRFVFLSSSQALIAQVDSTASASGTMDLQTSVNTPSGGYAFVVSGTDVSTTLPTAFGGIFNIDSPNTISGNGSISDQNLAGALALRQTLSGTISNPDAFGAVTIDLSPGFAGAPVQFIGYIVDSTHMKLIETDNSSGTGFGSTGGIAIGQGPATGTFTSVAALSGDYVFGMLGDDLSIPNILGIFEQSTFTSIGRFTANGSGNLTHGFTDTFLQGNCAQPSCAQTGILGAKISGAFTGTYAIGNTGLGRGRALFTFSPQPTPAFQPQFFFYLTGPGSPVLLLDGGDLTVNNNYPSMGVGIAYPQSVASLTFGGTYGFSLVQQNGTEVNSTAQLGADTTVDTLSGLMDTSFGSFDNDLTGSFNAPSSNGRFAANLSSQAFEFTSPITSSLTTEFYVIDPNHGFFVETDLKDPNGPSGVVSFGYYAARTPVCAGCP